MPRDGTDFSTKIQFTDNPIFQNVATRSNLGDADLSA
jgi:hypothetical protein